MVGDKQLRQVIRLWISKYKTKKLPVEQPKTTAVAGEIIGVGSKENPFRQFESG